MPWHWIICLSRDRWWQRITKPRDAAATGQFAGGRRGSEALPRLTRIRKQGMAKEETAPFPSPLFALVTKMEGNQK